MSPAPDSPAPDSPAPDSPAPDSPGPRSPAPDDQPATPTAGLVTPAGGLVVPVVTRGGLEDGGTGQSTGASRISGVSPQHTPATRLWFGKVRNEPGFRSVPHHHGEAETGGYVLDGRARIYFGPEFADYIDMSEGDWVFVPPWMPHVECNLDRNRPLTWMTTRTPDNIVVNLPDVADDLLRHWADR